MQAVRATLGISDRKKTENDLREANEALAAYKHMVSRDLKRLVASLLMGAKLLENYVNDPSGSPTESLVKNCGLMGNKVRVTIDNHLM